MLAPNIDEKVEKYRGIKMKLEADDSLSADERRMLIQLIELFALPKKRGRPKGRRTTSHRNIKLYLEYETLKERSGSESAWANLKDKYKFKDISSVKIAVRESRTRFERFKNNGSHARNTVIALIMHFVEGDYKNMDQAFEALEWANNS